MQINIITLFPEIFDALNYGLLGQAIDRKEISINLINLRDFSMNDYGQIDDKPYGGGEGMVLMIEPLSKALESMTKDIRGYVINMSPQGERLSNNKAKEISTRRSITIIAGRYEGVDERFIQKHVDEEISIGDYILSGGEFAALSVIDAAARMIPGVIGNQKSIELDSFSEGLLKGPVYTRPEIYNELSVPEVLLSGNHGKIHEWKESQAIQRTLERRPELLNEIKLTKKQKKLLEDLSSKSIL